MKPDPSYVSFLPDFCGSRILFVVILVAELLAIVLALEQLPDIDSLINVLAMYSLFIQWIALCCVAALCLCRPYLIHLSDHWVATLSYGITLLVSLVIIESTWWLVHQWPQGERYIASSHGLFVIRSMSISAVVCALALRYFYVLHQWRIRIKSEADARYQALQSRIRPHFLFNCMNTIASMIRRQPVVAEQAIEDLADLFRASLSDVHQSHTLQDEIELCRRYLRIEKHRLGDRLELAWDIDSLPGDIRFPALCLQPLLENAIYHGIEVLPGGGTVEITGRADKHYLHITVRNPIKPGNQPQDQPGNRLAQDNINQRLAALYDQTSPMRVVTKDNFYSVTLNIPRP